MYYVVYCSISVFSFVDISGLDPEHQGSKYCVDLDALEKEYVITSAQYLLSLRDIKFKLAGNDLIEYLVKEVSSIEQKKVIEEKHRTCITHFHAVTLQEAELYPIWWMF